MVWKTYFPEPDGRKRTNPHGAGNLRENKMLNLPPHEKKVVDAFIKNGEDPRATAKALGCSRNFVYRTLRSVYAKMATQKEIENASHAH